MRLGNEVIGELAQVPITIAPAEGRLGRPLVDKSAHSSTSLQHPGPLEFGINFGDRIGIDSQLDRQLPDGGQLVTDAQLSGGYRKLNRPFELVIKRRRMFGVDVEHLIAVLYYDNGTSKVSRICRRY